MYDTPLRHIINIYIYINSYQLDSSEEFPCEQNPYSSCLRRQRDYLNTSCFLPFEENTEYRPICKTDEEGYHTMFEVSKLISMCKQSCTIIDIEVQEIPQTYGALFTNEHFATGLLHVTHMIPGYYINTQQLARSLSVIHDYGFISYVAEFAGWSGILVGASLLGLLKFTTSLISKLTSIRLNQNVVLCITKIFSMIYIAYLLFTCCTKFNDSPKGIMVDFDTTEIDFVITICAPRYILAFRRNSFEDPHDQNGMLDKFFS